MAPVLLCPECGTKHPLEGIGSRSAFPCTGCGRTLKVPAVAQVATGDLPMPSVPAPSLDLPWPVASGAPAPALDGDPHATQVFPNPLPPLSRSENGATPIPPPAPAPGTPPPEPVSGVDARDLIPPRGVRFLLWFVAVPVGFLVVFVLARAVGLLDTNQVTDVALAEGWGRFWPIVRLLPFVALATAGIVQGSVYGIARLRANRRRPPSASGTERSSGTKSRSQSRQSSRTDA